MDDSILNTIRTLLVGDEDDTSFDDELIVDINAALNNLTDVGVGPEEGFIITGSTEAWEDFIEDHKLLERVKNYVKLETRLLFDPPTASYVLESMQKKADEALWRINVTVDTQGGKKKEGY